MKVFKNMHSDAEILALRRRIAELEDSTRMYEGILARTPIAFGIIDAEFRYQYVNEALAQLNCVPAAAHIGRRTSEVVPDVAARMEPVVRGVLETGEAVIALEATGFIEGQKRHAMISFYPVRTGERITGVAFTVVDITERKERELALETANRFLSLAQQSANAGFWRLDLIQKKRTWTPECHELFGVPQGTEVTDEVLLSVVHPEDREEVRSYFSGRLRYEDRIESCYRIRRQNKDGRLEQRWIRSVGAVTRLPDGTAASAVGIAIDQTSQKLSELALDQANQRFEDIVQISDAVFWIADALSKRVLYASPAYERIWGRPVSQLYDRPDDWIEAVHEDDRPRVVAALKAGVSGRAFDIDFRVVGPDGGIRWVRDRAHSVRDRDGREVRRIGIAQDITDRKEAELNNRTNTERFVLAQHAASIGIWDWDIVSGERWFTPEYFDLFGLPRDSPPPTYEDFIARVHPEDVATAQQRVQNAVTGKAEFDFEFRVVWPDASVHWITSKGRAFHDDSGNPVRLIGVNLDITERKRIEESLRRMNHDLSQFAYAASHDLQEPLRVMSSYTRLLEKQLEGGLDPTSREYMNFIVEGSERMRSLLSDLLEYTRITRDLEEESPESADANEVLASVLKNLSAAAKESNAVITADPLPTVPVRRVHMVQLLQNLIGNAIKYRGSDPPRIHVSSVEQAPGWVFSVQDNGIGIAPKYFERIFGVFKRLHGRNVPGTGIGLAICQRLVQIYGGKIWVESEPERGSTFYFTVPADGGH
jgi:PAS domain S-box-containing protein